MLGDPWGSSWQVPHEHSGPRLARKEGTLVLVTSAAILILASFLRLLLCG